MYFYVPRECLVPLEIRKVLEPLEFINSCEPSHGYWEPNGGTLQEQPALLAAEPQHLALTVPIKPMLS